MTSEPSPQKLAAEYRDGASLSQLAQKYQTNMTAVRKHLLEQGVEMRPRWTKPPIKYVDLPESAVDEYRDGATMQQIADRYGCSKGSVLTFLRDRGIERRPKPDWTDPSVRPGTAPPGPHSARTREERYAERYWIEDPSYWPPVGPIGGYWVHPDPPRGHGDNATYVEYGCRCPECRDANADYQWYIKRGLTPPNKERRKLPIEEIVELYEVGCTSTELAEHYGVNNGTINRLLHGAGVPVRRPGLVAAPEPAPEPAPAVIDDDQVILNLDDTARLLKRGDNLDYVAQQLDADTDDLRQALKAAGYKIPGHRDPNDPERIARQEKHRAASAARAKQQRKEQAEWRAARIAEEQEKADERKARAAERVRLQAAARRYAEIRGGENEFERRERAQLRDWLAEHADVLTDIPDPWVVHLRELQAKARTVNGVTPQDAPERRASEELSKLLADALANGQTAYSLAKLLGVTPAAINLRVRRHGYAPPYPSQPVAYGAPHSNRRR